MDVLEKNPNSVSLSVFFKNLPERESMELWNLATRVRSDAWVTRRRILSDPEAFRDRPYYDVQMQLAEFMQDDGDLHTCMVPVRDVDYGLYSRFSGQYGIDMDINLLKSGSRVLECTDPSDPAYYNNMCVVIAGGRVCKQTFSHATEYGIITGEGISFSGNECVDNIAACYPKLMGVLACMDRDGSRSDRRILPEVPRIESTVGMDYVNMCFE